MLGTSLEEDNPYYHTRIGEAVKYFHENQQSFENKDINSYKGLEELELAVQSIKDKKKEKSLKKQRDIIYKDDRYLVVSPKTHEASCTYGAGTKWCVTQRDSDRYWRQYSKRATFFFIIDKTKDESDPLYKVASCVFGDTTRYLSSL